MKDKVSPGAVAAMVGVGIFLVVALLFGFTVVSTEEEAALTIEFDPVVYVEDNWEMVKTAIVEDAVPLADVLNEIEPGPDGKIATEDLTPIAEAMGRITTGEAHVYSVTGSGTVTDVDIESSKGSIGIDLDGFDGPIQVRAWIGTRIPSDVTSIRDVTGFIEFNDFSDQTQYGKVAKELNQKVVSALEDLDKENLLGKSVDFTGAFTLRTFNQPTIDMSQIELVPIEITER